MPVIPQLFMAAASVAQTGTAALSAAASSAATASAHATGSGVPQAVTSFVATTIPSIVASALPAGVTTTTANAAKIGAVTVPPVYELLAVFAGALSGGLSAVQRRFDVVGVLTIAIVGGMGGGVIRDVLLQRYGIAALHDNRYLAVAVAAALVAFFFSGAIKRLATPLVIIDAVSLGLFAVVGADKALRADMAILPAIMLGTITAVGGGLLRDLLHDEIPQILQPGALYSAAALVGSTMFVTATVWLGVLKQYGAIMAVGMAVGLRLLAMWRGWRAPVPRDYTDVVLGAPKKMLAFTPLYGGKWGHHTPPGDETPDDGPGPGNDGKRPDGDDDDEGPRDG